MGRFWLGTVLLAVLLVLGLWLGAAMDDALLPIADTLDRAAQNALEGNKDAAIGLVENAGTRWKARWHRIAAFSDHAPMEEIDGLFAQLPNYETDTTMYAACCARLSGLIRAVADAHSPVWWNLL